MRDQPSTYLWSGSTVVINTFNYVYVSTRGKKEKRE